MFNNRLRRLSIALLCIGIVCFTFSFKSNFFEISKQLEIYTTLFKELNIYYFNEINPAEFTNKAIKNTLKDLDPYTNYYDEQEVEEAKIRREGEYAGIGVSVYYSKKGIILKEIYKGFEADKKKLKAGDIIKKVGSQNLENMNISQMSEILKGAPNTSLDLEILREGKIKKLTVVIKKIEINPVPFYHLIDKEIGYIVLTRFNQKASSEVKKAFQDLKKRGMKKLIFDLRNNPGGSLGEAINISNFFLPKGSIITSTKAKVKKWSNTYRASNNPLDLEIPMAVLVNEKSASASEIVAGALQDFDRAVILGERSFGKGLVQKYRQLSYGTQLKLTISKYYTPSGRCIQELDYSSRNSAGDVPKFSDQGVNTFKTKNGRAVYDGGGITPDIFIGFNNINTVTKDLVKSRVIFDFVSEFSYRNPKINSAFNFSISTPEFNEFLTYVKERDTIFKTRQERSFLKAYKSFENNKSITKEYEQIKTKLVQNKVLEIAKNQEYLTEIIKENILTRYYYKEGAYQNKLKKDKVILKAITVLKQKSQYLKILTGA